MLSEEECKCLGLGDVLETVTMLPKLSEELILMEVVSIKGNTVSFYVTYHGVRLGTWTATTGSGVVVWGKV